MKYFSFKKIIAASLALILVLSPLAMIPPQQASAQLAVVDAGDTIENTFSAVANGSTAGSTYAMMLKSFTLDKIATAIAKQILMQLTLSVVNWINSGFRGNPSFLTNPAGFFLDVADQLTGQFIASAGLKSLCSPFGLDVRLALALKFSAGGGFGYQRYTCTLSSVLKKC